MKFSLLALIFTSVVSASFGYFTAGLLTANKVSALYLRLSEAENSIVRQNLAAADLNDLVRTLIAEIRLGNSVSPMVLNAVEMALQAP